MFVIGRSQGLKFFLVVPGGCGLLILNGVPFFKCAAQLYHLPASHGSWGMHWSAGDWFRCPVLQWMPRSYPCLTCACGMSVAQSMAAEQVAPPKSGSVQPADAHIHFKDWRRHCKGHVVECWAMSLSIPFGRPSGCWTPFRFASNASKVALKARHLCPVRAPGTVLHRLVLAPGACPSLVARH